MPGRLVLSAWRADANIVDRGTQPLWLISAVEEAPKQIAFGLGHVAADDASDTARDHLKGDLEGVWMVEKQMASPLENRSGSIILAQDAR